MGILTSMFTAVSGLSTYGNALGVIGNNIANVGTVGFKGSRSSFAELVSSSLSSSQQVGLGVRVASVDGNFSQGSLNTPVIRSTWRSTVMDSFNCKIAPAPIFIRGPGNSNSINWEKSSIPPAICCRDIRRLRAAL